MKTSRVAFIFVCMILMQRSPGFTQVIGMQSGPAATKQDTSEPINDLVKRLGRQLDELDDRVSKLEGMRVSASIPSEPSTRQREPNRNVTRSIDNGQNPRLNCESFHLVGGYIVPQAFARPGLAIDFINNRVYAGTHAHENGINVYNLPTIGTEENIGSWPRLSKIDTISVFWDVVPTSQRTDANGIEIRGDKLWVSPRGWYTQTPQPFLRLFGKSLANNSVEMKEIAQVPTQAYGGGFLKGHPTKWLVGCGGHVSGQGSTAGPTAATTDGEILLSQVDFGLLNFNAREKRPPTLWPIGGIDNWQAMMPRNGVGAWGADRVTAGGVWTDRGLCYWPSLHTGEASYHSGGGQYSGPDETWLYTYDPITFDNVEFEKWTHGAVIGHEIGPNGLIYLLIRNGYKASEYSDYSVIKVFQLHDGDR